MEHDMPMMEGLIGEDVEGTEEPDEEMEEDGSEYGSMLEEAQHYANKAETYAADCEAIAEMVPDAATLASDARSAADEASSALPDVEAAQTAYDGAVATSGTEAPETVEAMRALEDSVRIVKEAYERSMRACDAAKEMMPSLETGPEPGGELMEWAEQTA